MPQENLNKIWNAGKYFEPKPEQQTKEPTPAENKPSNIKRKINVAKAFIPTQEDPFKKKVEAVLKGIEETEPASAKAMAGKKKKPVPADTEEFEGWGQDKIGRDLVAGKSIRVKGHAGDDVGFYMSGGKIHIEEYALNSVGRLMYGGEIQIGSDAGIETGSSMSGGEIHVKGNAGRRTGDDMLGGTLRIDGDVASFDRNAFTPKNKGTIIWKKQTIWKNGQKEEPGWTNLKVEEKIAK